ncbi:hypothetical protein [Microbacterium sp. A84]|uniref:hypothetical protein n=1 Tax=Microbacterium sp. A84 TaxID=3450715 RepID=UPI003F42AEA0
MSYDDDYDNGFYDGYHDHSYSMLRSSMRVRVTALTVPPTTRTFDMSQRASESQLIDAFLLATGHSELGEAHDYDSYQREVRSVTFGADRTIDVPGVAEGCLVDVMSSRNSKVGEPRVQIVDDDSAARTSGPWQSAPAPLRNAHVQQELTRMFGVVLPEVDTSGAAELSREFGASPLTSLLLTLPPARRLALRAHLTDSGLLESPPLDAKTARLLMSGVSWLTHRLGPEGVEQDEHGGFPEWLAREAETAMEWVPASGSPPSPGHALLGLARSAHFTRRLKGSIMPTVKSRAIKEKPLRALEDVRRTLHPGRGVYTWGPDHASTLALLAIADGSGAAVDGVIDQVAAGLRTLKGAGDGSEQEARETVRGLMETLAPLGGPGSYGMLTPPVRAFARMQLF